MKMPLLRPLRSTGLPRSDAAPDFQREFYESGYGTPPLAVPARSPGFNSWLPATSRIDVAISLLPGGRRLLDVGCGDGQLLRQASAKYQELFGVDIAANRLKTAREKLEGLPQPSDLRTLNLDREDLPFASDYFDAVTAVAVLPFIFDVDHALGEMARVLQPGGSLVLETNNLGFIGHRLAVLFKGRLQTSYFYGWDGNTLHYFSQRPLLSALDSYGLQKSAILASGRLRKIRSLWPAILGGNLVVLARKARRNSRAA